MPRSPRRFAHRAAHSRWLALLVALATLLVGPPTLAVAAPGAPSAPVAGANTTVGAACLDAEEIAFLGTINGYRAQLSLAPLRATQSLTAASEHHSVNMAQSGVFDHVMSDGTTVEQNVKAHGYPGSLWGENIAAGTYMSTGQSAFNAWRDSPGHNANMLRPTFGAIGIAREYNPSSQYGWYWTTIFGGAADAAAVSCSGAPVPNPAPVPTPAPTPAPTTAPAPAPAPTIGANAATTTDLNLRAGAGTTFEILAVMPAGARVAVTGAAVAGFHPVAYGALAGWAAADFVLLDGAAPTPVPAPASAPTPGAGTAVATTDLNLRAGPSTADTVLLVLPAGATVNLTGGASNGFAGVAYNGTSGWAFADFLGSGTGPAPNPAPAPGGSAFTTTDVNLRAGPGTGYDVLAVMPAGAGVAPTGGAEAGFLAIRYGGLDGWAAADFIGGVAPAPAPVPSGDSRTATTDLNLRAGPGTTDAILAVIPPGGTVTLLGEYANGFTLVAYAGTTGWAFADYLG